MRCICGHDEFDGVTKPVYEVDKAGTTARADGRPTVLGACRNCGIIRQVKMPFIDEKGFTEYYRTEYAPTNKEYGAKDYAHDLELARVRCKDYGIADHPGRVLDVGSGSGAFVEAAREVGAEAYGCEIGRYHYAGKADRDFVYRGRFEDLAFPTDHFDMVVSHDVLEHVLDPVGFVSELFRVTKQDGDCIVDFPRYFHQAGQHHWKRFEHIWYFTPEQVEMLLVDAGFDILKTYFPIESKVVFRLSKPRQIRPTILLPPGIGDAYWSVVKLRAFLKREGLGIPDVGIVSPREKYWNGHMRAFPFLAMFPFLNSSLRFVEGRGLDLRPVWNEAYLDPGRTIFKGIAGFDYFISYNAHLRVGKSLDQVDPDLACDWSPPAFVSLDQIRFRERSMAGYKKYLVAYFVFQGTNKYVLEHFSIGDLANWVIKAATLTGSIPVFVGAEWDLTDKVLEKMISMVTAMVPGTVNLVGKTDLHQLFGLMKGAAGIMGVPSGITIMSSVMNLRTSILWSHWFPEPFIWNCCPPHVKETTYRAEFSPKVTLAGLVDGAVALFNGEEYIHKPGHIRPPTVKVSSTTPARNKPRPRPKAKPSGGTGPAIKFKSKPPASPPQPEPVTIVCVLKSGGDFNGRYVANMKGMLSRNITREFKFICLTDMDITVDGCSVISLKDELAGWWSKTEIFRPGQFDTKRIVYLDLDTIILRNIDDFLDLKGRFYGLRPWNLANRNRGYCASGLMAWENGSCDFIYSSFNRPVMGKFYGDQAYMSETLRKNSVSPLFLQDHIQGIYSYKKQCRNGLPSDARIICFHGRPRVHECQNKWVREAWR